MATAALMYWYRHIQHEMQQPWAERTVAQGCWTAQNHRGLAGTDHLTSFLGLDMVRLYLDQPGVSPIVPYYWPSSNSINPRAIWKLEQMVAQKWHKSQFSSCFGHQPSVLWVSAEISPKLSSVTRIYSDFEFGLIRWPLNMVAFRGIPVLEYGYEYGYESKLFTPNMATYNGQLL